jgi:glycosyltransferase involved in cell wall biosynthesis
MRKALAASSHVFYQSDFCKLAGDRFLGEPAGSWEILHNAVDTTFFAPPHSDRPKRPLTLLLGGTQYQRYRYETALETLLALVKAGEDVRLIVTGELSWGTERAHSESEGRELATRLGLADRIEHAGSYLQVDAPRLFARADLLLHTKYNDPCPTVVLEAMACGLPVAYSASGGVPELVGDTGIGVPAELDWEQDHPPDPDALAAAVVGIGQRLEELAAMARARVVQRFDIEPWVERHRAVFTELLG